MTVHLEDQYKTLHQARNRIHNGLAEAEPQESNITQFYAIKSLKTIKKTIKNLLCGELGIFSSAKHNSVPTQTIICNIHLSKIMRLTI